MSDQLQAGRGESPHWGSVSLPPSIFTQYFCANSLYFLRPHSFLQVVAAYGRGAASRDRKRKGVTWGDQGGSTAKRSKSSYR